MTVITRRQMETVWLETEKVKITHVTLCPCKESMDMLPSGWCVIVILRHATADKPASVFPFFPLYRCVRFIHIPVATRKITNKNLGHSIPLGVPASLP